MTPQVFPPEQNNARHCCRKAEGSTALKQLEFVEAESRGKQASRAASEFKQESGGEGGGGAGPEHDRDGVK